LQALSFYYIRSYEFSDHKVINWLWLSCNSSE